LVGEWFEISDDGAADSGSPATAVDLELFDDYREQLTELLERAEEIDYASHAWKGCAGVELGTFLAQPLDHWRGRLRQCLIAARAADETADPAIPPFALLDLAPQSAARSALADELESLVANVDPAPLAHWARQGSDAVFRAQQQLAAATPHLEVLQAGSLEPELALAASAEATGMADVNRQLAALDGYREVADQWYRFFCWTRRSQAAEVLNRYGLSLKPDSVERLHTVLTGRRARLVLQASAMICWERRPAPNRSVIKRWTNRSAA